MTLPAHIERELRLYGVIDRSPTGPPIGARPEPRVKYDVKPGEEPPF